jgi:surfeit locus 1 family protein
MPPPRVTVAIAAALLGVAATLALGMWQLRRAAEKTALERSWEAARNGAPRVVRTASDLRDVAASVPTRVRVRGEFDNTHTWWLDNRPLAGRAGFVVVAPLRIEGTQDTILVSRGWAPRDPLDRTRLPAIRRPAGLVDVEGIAVANVPRVYELGEHGSGRIRQNLDFKDAAAEIGSPVAQFVIQQTSPLDDALDRHWTPPASGVERNRGYAFQWFSLSALIVVLLFVFGARLHRSRSRMGRVA